jgi:hypothetical protein
MDQWAQFESEKNTIVSKEMGVYNSIYKELGVPALIMKE